MNHGCQAEPRRRQPPIPAAARNTLDQDLGRRVVDLLVFPITTWGARSVAVAAALTTVAPTAPMVKPAGLPGASDRARTIAAGLPGRARTWREWQTAQQQLTESQPATHLVEVGVGDHRARDACPRKT